MNRHEDLERIREALEAAREAVEPFTPGSIAWDDKGGGDPVTAADTAIDRVLREILPKAGEGWLSEETVDDRSRVDAYRAWVVDPLDGTPRVRAGHPRMVHLHRIGRGRTAGGRGRPESRDG